MDMLGIRRIMQVAITVGDLERAIGFYRDTLGMRFLFRAGEMAFLDCAGVRILLGTENAAEQRTFLYFEVPDIAAAHEMLLKSGVQFDEEPRVIAKLADRDVWLAAFRDPDGTLHHLMSETVR